MPDTTKVNHGGRIGMQRTPVAAALGVVSAGHDEDLTAEDAEVRRGHPSRRRLASSALDTTKI